ncbi:MAG: MoaD/ThiS family protein [Actinobacteria bacterium]|nr:MoaD/ThiS family protein [Actinomycetota bacterium]
MKVKIFATLRQYVNSKEVEVNAKAGDKVRDVLEKLVANNPELGKRIFDKEGNLQRSIRVLVKGRNIEFKEGLNTILKKNDYLALFPPVGGG